MGRIGVDSCMQALTCPFKEKSKNTVGYMALTGQVSASKTVVTRAINYIKQKTQGRCVEQGQSAD